MRVGLLSMPWSSLARPSPAVGALSAYVAEERPDWEVFSASSHVKTAVTLGFDLYTLLEQHAHSLGELLYMGLLYPQKMASVREYFLETTAERLAEVSPGSLIEGAGSWDDVFEHTCRVLEQSVSEAVEDASIGLDVVGLTTCFGQLFANLNVARALKEACPQTAIVLGGSTLSGPVGPSILAEYPYIDHMVQGEGEQALVALLRSLEEGDSAPIGGVLSRRDGRPPTAPATRWQVDDLDELPVPDYDEYAEIAEAHGIDWLVPIQGSRGCWWNRSARTKDPRHRCFFCNLDVQWKGYREKSIGRVVAEVDELSERYSNPKLIFLDSVLRSRGIEDLARGMASLGKDLDFFYEVRASARPHQLLALWQAGLSSVQSGIEGLSTALLQRMGKGTSTIQNLEVMKTCDELGIEHYANIITHFPGATAEEIQETARNIREYAFGFTPCKALRFHLGMGSTVALLPDEFGISNVRNDDIARLGLPEEVWQRIRLGNLSYDLDQGEQAEWEEVDETCRAWQARHDGEREPLLEYCDGGTFVRISDRRHDPRVMVLSGLTGEVFRYCLQIRGFDQIAAAFQDRGITEQELGDALGQMVEERIVFREGSRYLALAVALNSRIAARRIAASQQAEPLDG